MNQWSSFLKHLETLFDKATLDQWLKPLKVVNFDARNLYLRADNEFQIAWFNEHIKDIASEKLLSSSGRPIRVRIICDEQQPETNQTQPTKVEAPTFSSDFCDPDFTFDTFFAAGKSLFSHHIIENLLEQYQNGEELASNPLFIYGPTASGKTHLLTAMAHKLESLGKKVFFVHALTFASHVIHAFRGSLLHEFRQTYRNIDALIIDDIHLLKRKVSSQEELFHTFNQLHTRKKLIVLSSNTLPSQLEDIEERLVSRFEWGLSLALERPNSEQLALILDIKAKALGLTLTKELEQWLLNTFESPIALTKAVSLLALHHRGETLLDIDRAQFYLADLILMEKSKQLTLEGIVSKVCSYYGIKDEDVLGRSQNKEASLPRQISMYMCREKMKTPYLQLGSFFNRDHSTVITSVKGVKNKIKKKEPAILTAIDKITQALG